VRPVPISRVAHCNLNCSSLDRSLAFYRDAIGLHPNTHTAPAPQPAGGFPLPPGATTVQWDAWIMHEAGAGHTSPALDLLEWKHPAPFGRPYPAANHLGLNRLRYAVPDVRELHERFVAGGGTAFGVPADAIVDVEAGRGVLGFAGLDPDGVLLEFVERDVAAVRPLHVGANCTDLDASIAWYAGNLGLEVVARAASDPQPGAVLGLDGDCWWTSALLRLPGSDGFGVELRQWHEPPPTGVPYQIANHLGIYRLAFMVGDIHAAHETLVANGVDGGEPVALDMGPEVPIEGGLWASFFPDPDGACVEFIEELRSA
jgi:catechol 2,3-dioxygenase-like lactoylglutathione lyase family enzyme